MKKRAIVVPETGNAYLDEAARKQKGPNYLFDEFAERIANRPVAFKLLAQLAKDGDVVDDATVHWHEDRELLQLGRFELTAAVANDAKEQKHIIFDPIPRVDGIEASADPLPAAAWGDRGDAKPDRTPLLNSSSFFFSWLLEEPRSTSSNWTPMALSSESSLVPFLE